MPLHFVPIKYGFIRGYPVISDAVPVAASQIFTNGGGHYCKLNASGQLVIMAVGDTQAFGWANTGAYTSNATAGYDSLPVDVSLLSVYRLPSDSAPTATSNQKVCDLLVSANIQKASISLSAQQIVKIVDFDNANSTVDVMLNTQKFFTATAP